VKPQEWAEDTDKYLQIQTSEGGRVMSDIKHTNDPTESIRREMVKEINAVEGSREQLEAKYGQVWDTKELQNDFSVEGFMAPFVSVKRKSDNAKGTLEFQHGPRLYFNFSV